jgi:hypothetical protein
MQRHTHTHTHAHTTEAVWIDRYARDKKSALRTAHTSHVADSPTLAPSFHSGCADTHIHTSYGRLQVHRSRCAIIVTDLCRAEIPPPGPDIELIVRLRESNNWLHCVCRTQDTNRSTLQTLKSRCMLRLTTDAVCQKTQDEGRAQHAVGAGEGDRPRSELGSVAHKTLVTLAQGAVYLCTRMGARAQNVTCTVKKRIAGSAACYQNLCQTRSRF